MSILNRISRIIRSIASSFVDRFEDPAIQLDRIVEDMSQEIAQMRKATADAIAQKNLLQRTYDEYVAEAERYEVSARKAVVANRDDLALPILAQKNAALAKIQPIESVLKQQELQAQKLKSQLFQLESELEAVKSKKQLLKAQAIGIAASDRMSRFGESGAMQAFHLTEEKIARLQAKNSAMEELNKTGESELTRLLSDADAEADLKALKAKLGRSTDSLTEQDNVVVMNRTKVRFHNF